MRCSICGKELRDVRYCTFCKSPICLDCIRYEVVKRKSLHKEYEETIPLCKNCLPELRFRKKLAKIVDDVFSQFRDLLE